MAQQDISWATGPEAEHNDNTRRILDALKEKLGDRLLQCPISGDTRWVIQNYFAVVPATENFPLTAPAGILAHSFPLVVLMCENCGYSLMFNLFGLGIADDFGVPRTPDDLEAGFQTGENEGLVNQAWQQGN